MVEAIGTDLGGSQYQPERTEPFKANYALVVTRWSMYAGGLAAAVLLVGRLLGLEQPGIMLPMITLAVFYVILSPVAFFARRYRNSWDERLDLIVAGVMICLDIVTGSVVLFATGGPESALLLLVPVVPFALRLMGRVIHSVVFAAALILALGAMTALEEIGNGIHFSSVTDNLATHHPAVAITLVLTVSAAVIASTILADSTAKMLRRREAEALEFSEKMNLRAEKLGLLLRVGRLLSRTTSFDDIARGALEHIHQHFEAYATVLYLQQPGGRLEVVQALGDGIGPEADETTLAMTTLAQGHARLWPPNPSGDGSAHSAMVAPLLVEGTGYGAIKVVAPSGADLNQSKLALLETIAAELAGTLRTAGAYQATNADLSRAAAELEALNAFTRKISASFDLQAISDSLLEMAIRVTTSDHGNITIMREDGAGQEVVRFMGYDEVTERRLRALSWGLSRGLYGRALRTARPVCVGDVTSDLDYVPVMPDVRSKMCVPIVVSGRVEGMVNLESAHREAYSKSDVDFVAALAESTAVSVKNARLYRTVEEAARRDGLTGLYNHSYLHQRLEQELERSQRYARRLSLIIMDVDDFKQYNDLNGHLAGDQVLRWLGQTLLNTTRRVDVVARYGGEEFAVIMPETTHDSALQAAEKLRALIDSKQPSSWPAQLTLSFGVASYPDDGRTSAALVDIADQRMYLAKRAGKNQVIAFG